MRAMNSEKVLSVHHWTDELFSFTTTRDPGFRFKNGQFTMIGLQTEGKPLMRAYSMVSANYEDHLEFFSIKVQDGPLTSRLQHIQEGDEVLVNTKPTGTLVVDHLKPGKRLWMMSTGTGLAPFMSLIKDPYVYESFDQVILVHGCRYVNELAYEQEIIEDLPNDELIGELISEQLLYYPTVTREDYKHQGRITELLENGKLSGDLGLPQPNTDEDRFMLCGSPAMLDDMCVILERNGFHESRHGEQAEYVIERAFVEK